MSLKWFSWNKNVKCCLWSGIQNLGGQEAQFRVHADGKSRMTSRTKKNWRSLSGSGPYQVYMHISSRKLSVNKICCFHSWIMIIVVLLLELVDSLIGSLTSKWRCFFWKSMYTTMEKRNFPRQINPSKWPSMVDSSAHC